MPITDNALVDFLKYGTNAQRLLFAPQPPDAQIIYFWYETDTGNTFLYADGVWYQVNFSGTIGTAQHSFLISGGAVVWIQNYEFLVSAATYSINGILYNSPESSITLDASDPTNDRIDIIAVDDTETVVKVTGTPAAQPSEPDIDPGTQIKLALVLVPAASTQPVVNTETLYYDNAGGPTEWNWTTSGSGFNVNSTNNPKSPSTKDIEGTTVSNTAYAKGIIPSGTYDPNTANLLVLYIRSKATWANNRGLQISLRSGGVLVGTSIPINRTGSFGFDSSITGTYQLVAIPITIFAVPNGVLIDEIRITAFGSGHGFYIDDIYFQEEGTTQLPTGITLEQADARYQKKPVYANVGIVIDGGGSVITTGVKGFVRCPQAGTIVKATVLSIDDAATAGDIVIDVWKDTYANYPPTNADSITAAAPPTLSTANKSEDSTLTGWTTTVSAGDVLGFNVDSAATVTKVNLQLTLLLN